MVGGTTAQRVGQGRIHGNCYSTSAAGVRPRCQGQLPAIDELGRQGDSSAVGWYRKPAQSRVSVEFVRLAVTPVENSLDIRSYLVGIGRRGRVHTGAHSTYRPRHGTPHEIATHPGRGAP